MLLNSPLLTYPCNVTALHATGLLLVVCTPLDFAEFFVTDDHGCMVMTEDRCLIAASLHGAEEVQ